VQKPIVAVLEVHHRRQLYHALQVSGYPLHFAGLHVPPTGSSGNSFCQKHAGSECWRSEQPHLLMILSTVRPPTRSSPGKSRRRLMISGGTPSLLQAATSFWMGSGVTAPRVMLSQLLLLLPVFLAPFL